MRPPHQVKRYFHNAKVSRAYQISFLRKGGAPICYGFYTSLMYIEPKHGPTPKTQEEIKNHLRLIRSSSPL